MPIYTKTGDRGTTALFGGKRVLKSDPQIEAYGGVDELSSFIGLVISKLNEAPDRIFLTRIQKSLYKIMGVLCLPAGRQVATTADLREAEKEIKDFEQYIDKMQSKLPKLTRFILPQGTEISVLFHILRVVCRRAERNVVKFVEESNISFRGRSTFGRNGQLSIVLKYLNRMSDLFFMLARKYNKDRELVV